MHRLFVAIDLPEVVKNTLVRLQGGLPGARWVPLEAMHLTLRFIGEVDGAQVDDIHGALSRVTVESFTVRLFDAGAFPNRGRPRVVWAGVERSADLDALKARIDAALGDADCGPDERKFAPHVTLARLRGARPAKVADFVARIAPDIDAAFEARAFVLYASHLSSDGAVHIAEAVYPLEGA